MIKRIWIVLLFPLILSSCFTFRQLDISRLRTGMTKAQVEQIAGLPERLLVMNETRDGIQEVYQFRTSYDEVYALEFWNDYLTGFEFLYDDIPYVPAPMPPAVYPDYGHPVLPPNYVKPNKPNRPNRPRPPVRPNPPSNSGGAGTSRPSNSQRPTERPSTIDHNERPASHGRR